MNDDHLFRVILIVGSGVLLPIAAYHRLKSQATGEKLDRRQEGLFILFTLRPVGVVGMLGLIAYMVNPSWMAWSSVPLPAWLRWTGVGVGVIAGALLIWTLRSLGKNLTDTVVTRREHTLVTSGPYRWVRHPFYVSLALCVAANSLATANWFILASGALLFILIVIRTRKEEELLLTRFGDAYRGYMERTGRFLPQIGRGKVSSYRLCL
ncbi:MAG: isoprenylcysteine carboxylmethyltransferase family protein [Candidatus Methylomirabilales bacterium]